MTEAEWLTSADAYGMTKSLPQPLSVRRCLLAVCGYGRRIEQYIPHAAILSHLLECERAADGLATVDNSSDGYQTRVDVFAPCFTVGSPQFSLCNSLLWCLFTAHGEQPYLHNGAYRNLRTAITNLMQIDPGNNLGPRGDHSAKWRTAYEHEGIAQSDIVRDIFGNPFRPVALDPAWLTSTVVALAKGIYDERAFDRMPILADALQDAGCTSEDVLNHCRDPHQLHVRGCWVVDLLLGKA